LERTGHLTHLRLRDSRTCVPGDGCASERGWPAVQSRHGRDNDPRCIWAKAQVETPSSLGVGWDAEPPANQASLKTLAHFNPGGGQCRTKPSPEFGCASFGETKDPTGKAMALIGQAPVQPGALVRMNFPDAESDLGDRHRQAVPTLRRCIPATRSPSGKVSCAAVAKTTSASRKIKAPALN
jgi:hypothetical protein